MQIMAYFLDNIIFKKIKKILLAQKHQIMPKLCKLWQNHCEKWAYSKNFFFGLKAINHGKLSHLKKKKITRVLLA